MKLIVCPDRNGAAERLAVMLAESLAAKPALRLGLSAGSTSLLAYSLLVRRYHKHGGFSFRKVCTFSTDEYVGLPPEDHRSTRYLMNAHLYYQVDIPREQTFVPRGDTLDLDAECRAFDLLIEARGGLDLVVLGLGHNGHVGLNEPGSSPKSRTRVVDLTPSTVAAISGGERFTTLDETPSQAVSMGMSQILDARRVLIIATGIGKAEPVARMVTGRVGPGMPASLLTAHRDLTLITDQAAISQLPADTVEELS
ncbi:MAG: glucosamine-6-phosphate deaminase [Planctomycetes bacterium]|nr:glucosamine-6-phosphate deaminase [Planctomycetota bacterium]